MPNTAAYLEPSLYRHFFEASSEGMMITNARNEIIQINPAFTKITGYGHSEVLGQNPRILASGKHDGLFFHFLWEQLLLHGFWEGEVWNKRKNGEIFPSWQIINILKNKQGEISYFLTVFSDIMALKKAENETWKRGHYDILTGLLNRRALELRLGEEISSARRSGRTGALLFFDLDDFKKINDSFGHKAGDSLLIDVANRVTQYLRKEDVFARLGGDEFVVLLNDLPEKLDSTAQAVAGVIKNLLQLFRNPFLIESHALFVSASFGVTFYHPFAESPEQALKQADSAMYQSKQHGKNTYTFYHPAMEDAGDHRLQFEAELRHAIRSNQIGLQYQPQYDHHRQLLGYEALVRWSHPNKGLIMPSDFIAMAEETGIIIEMGEKIMEIACSQLADWSSEGKNIPKLSINVSPSQFKHHNFVDMMLATFRTTAVDPSKITLEVTENLIVSDVDNVIKKMNILKDRGVRFAIDDFGTGYSSLAYIQKLPLDQLKIDRSFIKDIASNVNDAIIVSTILSMAEHLNLEIIAEGVENAEQNDHLMKAGCKGFQGYWFGPPLSHHDINQSE